MSLWECHKRLFNNVHSRGKTILNWCCYPLACNRGLYEYIKVNGKTFGYCSWVLPQRDLASPPYVALCFLVVRARHQLLQTSVTSLPRCAKPGTMTYNTPSLPEVYLVGVSYHNRKRNCGSTYPPELEEASRELPTSPWRSDGKQVLNKIKRCRVGERHSVWTQKAPNVYLIVLPMEDGRLHEDYYYNNE